jgi:iron-sulfur cluster assembly protein
MAPQIMTLTPAAARRIRSILADRSDGTLGLRIGVKKGGCAGMEYTLTWATSVTPGDEVVEADGATVLIEPAAVLYLIGTEMDFRTDKLSSQFVFKNPNQKSACGCGESVNLVPATTAGRG